MSSVIALDVGNQRIGVARANTIARIASPLTTLTNNDEVLTAIMKLLSDEDATVLVVGLPRNMQSNETDQTRSVRDFVRKLQEHTDIPVHFQDEALTSQKAEAELNARRKPYAKGDVDALAATYILDDYLQEQGHTL